MTSTFFPSAVYLVLSSRSDRTKVEVHCKCPRAWFNRGHVLYMRRELMRDHLSLGSPRTTCLEVPPLSSNGLPTSICPLEGSGCSRDGLRVFHVGNNLLG